MKKIYTMLVLLISATLLIAACGQKSSSSGTTTQPSTPVDNTPAYDNTPSTPTTPSTPATPSTTNTQTTTTEAPTGFQNTDISDTQAVDTVLAPEVTVAAVPESQKICTVNADCIPKPECHPLECINKQYASQYTKPATCTAGIYGRAAESANDCSCNNGLCKNENNIV